MSKPNPGSQHLIDGTDMPVSSLFDRILPARLMPYAKLMRLDRPIGTWLLLFPCWWSTMLGVERFTGDWRQYAFLAFTFLMFGIGALVMRGAGCTWNDITDRNFDAKVERTRTRPIPSGQVSVRAAFVFLALQLCVGLAILLTFNWYAVAVGAASLVIVVIYPLMKRITYWPQIFLGLAFNWGALMGWAAVQGALGWPPVLLYVAGIFWTLGYDTIYAHQDKEDDMLIGVKSTALRLGRHTKPFLWLFYALAVALTAAAGALDGLGWVFFAGLGLGALQLAWQAWTVDIDDPSDCLGKFRSNRVYGWLLLAALVGDLVIST
jgi:4-hydroxybenzoate polyprenyltransferase